MASVGSTKNIVFVTNTVGFFISHRLHLARGAMAKGYAVYLIAPPDAQATKLNEVGVTFLPIPLRRKSLNPIYELQTLFAMYRHVQNVRPDVLHLFTIKPVIYGTLLTRLCHIPRTVVTITGLGYVFMRPGLTGKWLSGAIGWLYRHLFAHQRIRVVFQNHDDQKMFLERRWITPGQSRVIPGTGVDTQFFQPTVKKQFEKIIVAFPARLLRDKGVHELLAAGRILFERRKLFEIWLCGGLDEGNPTSLTQDEMFAIKNLSYAKALGHCADMRTIYAEAHIVCLPSYREGIPLTLLEACACGLPIVTTDVPGCREVVTAEENGLLVPAQSAVALANALERLMDDDALRIQLGHVGRQRAEEKFAKEIVVAQNLEIYQ